MPTDAQVVLHEVSHRWKDGPTLFERLNASLDHGELVALTGPSGSGKSTLLSIIAGWLEPTSGSVERAGVERVHWVFQNPYGSPRRTARDHIAYPFLARGEREQSASASADDLLLRFGLEGRGDRLFADLSGGEAQRLMLARAVASEADLLLVDEPTAQLDRASARTINDVLSELASAGSIVLVASHDADTVDACDDVIDLGTS